MIPCPLTRRMSAPSDNLSSTWFGSTPITTSGTSHAATTAGSRRRWLRFIATSPSPISRSGSTSARIDATVLVQAAPTVAETEFLLAVAAASQGIVQGVVGWVDLAAPAAIATLEHLVRNRSLRGVRPMLQDIADPDWILRPDVTAALSALPALGLRFDALVTPRELPALLRMLDRLPELAVVVDHAAKPPIAASRREPWARSDFGGGYASQRSLQTVRSRDGSRPRVVGRHAPAVGRTPSRVLRPASPHLGQRLARCESCGRLRALARGYRSAACAAARGRSRGDHGGQRCTVLRP